MFVKLRSFIYLIRNLIQKADKKSIITFFILFFHFYNFQMANKKSNEPAYITKIGIHVVKKQRKLIKNIGSTKKTIINH